MGQLGRYDIAAFIGRYRHKQVCTAGTCLFKTVQRYRLDTPETNPEGFKATSLINKAKDLKGKLLICQGAVDDTVVWEHSLSFIQACIDLEIPVDYFPYPVAQHNVFGRGRIHLMDKVTQYFEDYL